MTTLLAAAAASLVAAFVIVSPRRTGFVLGVVVASNASVVLDATYGVPPLLLPLSLAAIGMGILRLVRAASAHRLRPPATWLPAAAVAVIAAILLSAAVGPFVAVDATSSANSVQRILEHFLVVLAVATVGARTEGFRAVLAGIVTAGAALSAITNVQAVTGWRSADFGGFSAWNAEVIGGTGDSLRAAGPFTDDPNVYAQYLVVAVAIAIGFLIVRTEWAARWRRWMVIAAIVSMVLAIAHTASRGGIVGLAVVTVAALIVGGADRRRVGIAIAAGVLLLVSPLGVGTRLGTLTADPTSAAADRGLRGRASEMIVAADMFVDHPLAGVGYGSYNDRYLDYSREVGIDDRFEDRSAHSLPLEIAAEQGLVGIIAWTSLAALAVVVIRRLRRSAPGLGTSLGLAVAGFAATALFLHDVHPRLMWSLVGLVIGGAFLADRAAVPAPPRRSEQRLRVAMVIQSYVPAVGGAERQLASLMPLLRERGVEPLVVTRSMAGRPRDDVVDGVPVIRLRVVGPKPVQSAMFVMQARAVLDRFDPHVVHAFDTLTPSTIALSHRRRTGTPVVTKLLRSGVLGDLHRLVSKPFGSSRRRRLVGEVDVFVAISSELDAELDRVGVPEDRRALIPNGVDTSRFSPPRRHTRRADVERFVVIATGRIAPEKRLVELAEVWHRVTARWPGARLVIVGDGPESARLESFDDVEFLGRRDDIPDLLRDADIYVSASRAEGLSNSLLEAMAVGVPPVVTDVGGARDAIRGRNHGVVVAADDLDALADAVGDLIGDRTRRRVIRRLARRRILDRYSLERTADNLVAVYDRLARQRWEDGAAEASDSDEVTSAPTPVGATAAGGEVGS